MTRRMAEIIARHSGQPLEQVLKDIDRDRFMAPEEAVAYGLVDEIIQRRPCGGGALMEIGDAVREPRGVRALGWRASAAYPARLYVADPIVAAALAVYGVPVVSPEWTSASATSSTAASAGSSTSSWSAASTLSSRAGASG